MRPGLDGCVGMKRSGGVKGIVTIGSVSKAQAISIILCCPQICPRLDLLSLECWVHGLYQGGLEPSSDRPSNLRRTCMGDYGMDRYGHQNVHSWFTWSDFAVAGQEPLTLELSGAHSPL